MLVATEHGTATLAFYFETPISIIDIECKQSSEITILKRIR